jgi:hypothetical protein
MDMFDSLEFAKLHFCELYDIMDKNASKEPDKMKAYKMARDEISKTFDITPTQAEWVLDTPASHLDELFDMYTGHDIVVRGR